MPNYTVVLKRPDDVGTIFGNLDHDIDIVTLTVVAASAREAVLTARQDVALEDHKAMSTLCVMTEKDKPKPRDYRLLVMYEGHHDPVLTGWDLLSNPL